MNCSPFLIVLLVPSLPLLLAADGKSAGTKADQSVIKKADQLSRALLSIFKDGTKVDEIEKAYSNVADAEIFDPKTELDMVKTEMEQYLKSRTAVAWNAKLSLEQRHLISTSREALENGTFSMESLNNPNSPNFVRYLNAKRMSDAAMIYRDGQFLAAVEANATIEVRLRPNPNFHGLATSSDASAVHVPTPIYNRDAQLLERIQWSDIDQQYRRNREQLKDLNFQKFCSESGFLRYFPSASWLWEDRYSELDLYDCRNTEWYVNAATTPRNLLILLDTSGSMLGQRFEIARQTIETILGTLSDNDFFNIIHFSKQAILLEECDGRELVQATLRNKKLLLSRLYNISSEGKADYELALHKAFVALMNLPDESVFLRSKEEAAREATRREAAKVPETETPADGIRRIVLEDNVLTVPKRFLEAINKFTGSQQRMGCQDMIILITDGAPGFYREIFDLYNREKRVRFFSFVVGEEAKDFEQVRWMACANRGFMAHISSMADVQEKVQQYVRVLSRTVSRQKAAFSEATPLWSEATRERMSDDFIVSVSFPSLHFALLDGSGYALIHPQLRPLEATGELKAGFNSLDWQDVEAQGTHSNWLHSFKCASGKIEPQSQRTLFAVEKMRHVYPQENHYQVVCIDGTPYSLVLAMPSGDTKRLKRVRSSEEVQLNWLKGNDWRLHPNWRYCHLNDSDAAMGPERAFREYAKQMKSGGNMPEFCRHRRGLVARALLDLQASNGFSELWRQEWERNKKNGVHLAFFVAPSGVVRFHNQSLGDRLLYAHPHLSATESGGSNQAYKHFLLELNPNAAEADFFRRAVRQPPDQITFDLNRETRLWQGHGRKTAYGHAENESLLALAYKTVRVDEAVAGVAGIEFLYDTLVAQMRHIGCLSTDNDRIRCYLLDEHGYVFFSSSHSTRYSDFIHSNIVLPQIALQTAQNMTLSGRKRKGQRAYIANRVAQQQGAFAGGANPPSGHQLELGRFFGHLNRVAEWTMELLLRKGLYKRLYFTDAQAVCDSQSAPTDWSSSQTWAPTAVAASAHRLAAFLQSSLSSTFCLLLQFGAFLSALLLPTELAHGLQLNTFASLLKVNDGRFPCRQHAAFYLAQPQVSAGGTDGALLESDSYERPCRQNAAQCAVRVFASWVPRTNLLLVTVHQGARSHCFHSDPAHCPMSQPSEIPFGFSSSQPPPDGVAEEPSPAAAANGQGTARQCATSRPQPRQQPKQCLRDEFPENEPTNEGCVGASATGARETERSLFWMAFLSSLLALGITSSTIVGFWRA
uniref:VWFA domain-containing protein n=1 Tax=Globodera rostochiensis TaxID=31243 RepID=A0A914I0S9_GLORO